MLLQQLAEANESRDNAVAAVAHASVEEVESLKANNEYLMQRVEELGGEYLADKKLVDLKDRLDLGDANVKALVAALRETAE